MEKTPKVKSISIWKLKFRNKQSYSIRTATVRHSDTITAKYGIKMIRGSHPDSTVPEVTSVSSRYGLDL